MKKLITLAVLLLCMGTSSQAKERIHRLETGSVFIPKGHVMAGLTAGYSGNQGDELNFFILNNISASAYSVSASPFIGYFIADNFAIGGRFNYKRMMLGIDGLKLNLGDDMNFSLNDINHISQKYQGFLFGRYYMALGNSRIFAMFAEMRLGYTYTEGKNTTGLAEKMSGSFQTRHTAGVYVNPGLCAFLNDFVTFEASVGILGIDYSWMHQVTNQVDKGRYNGLGAKFNVNLLSINLGMTVYF